MVEIGLQTLKHFKIGIFGIVDVMASRTEV